MRAPGPRRSMRCWMMSRSASAWAEQQHSAPCDFRLREASSSSGLNISPSLLTLCPQRRPINPCLMPTVELQNIHKRFGEVTAIDGISLKIAPGAVHGLLGENGAGKSTLMNILY